MALQVKIRDELVGIVICCFCLCFYYIFIYFCVQSTFDISNCQGTNKFVRDIESSTYRVDILWDRLFCSRDREFDLLDIGDVGIRLYICIYFCIFLYIFSVFLLLHIPYNPGYKPTWI